MDIHILKGNEVDQIIPSHIPRADAIAAAQGIVREAALRGITLVAVDENGEDVFEDDFKTLVEFIPHGRRIAANMMDRMAQNPAELHLLLSGSPKIADLITAAITDYFEKQIAIGKEYLAMPEHKRQRVHEQLLSMIAPQVAA